MEKIFLQPPCNAFQFQFSHRGKYINEKVQAAELELGSVWIGIFVPKIIKKNFNLPDGVEPTSILAVGYTEGEKPSPDRHAKTRKKLEETMFFESVQIDRLAELIKKNVPPFAVERFFAVH